jgi:hypothetical protein
VTPVLHVRVGSDASGEPPPVQETPDAGYVHPATVSSGWQSGPLLIVSQQ